LLSLRTVQSSKILGNDSLQWKIDLWTLKFFCLCFRKVYICQDIFFFSFQYFKTGKRDDDYNWNINLFYLEVSDILLSVYKKQKETGFSEKLDNIINNMLLLQKIKNSVLQKNIRSGFLCILELHVINCDMYVHLARKYFLCLVNFVMQCI
jgi:hypothetical protein